MIELIRREFVVDAPLAVAWQHLATVENWPSWAKHIKRIDLTPKGDLSLKSKGNLHLKIGMQSLFQMTEIAPLKNWKWEGSYLWLALHYDHQFESIDSRHTRMIWLVNTTGTAVGLVGKLFSVIYNKNLDAAIPNLQEEIRLLNV